MKAEKKRHRAGLAVLCVILGIFLLLAAAPFLYDAVAGFDDYDDMAALCAADTSPVELTADSDWGLTARLEKADLYTLAERQGAIDDLKEQLSARTGDRLTVKKYGFRLDKDRVELRAKVELFGFLPIQLRAEAELHLTPDTATVTLKKLDYGKWISVSPEKLAERLNIPELAEAVTIDISGETAALGIDGLIAENDGLTVHSNVAKTTADALLAAGPSDTARVLSLLGETVPPEIAAACSGDLWVLSESIATPESLANALVCLTAACEGGAETAARLLPEQYFWLELLPDSTEALQTGYSAMAETALERYEQTLSGLRDSYKRMEYTLTKAALVSADGQPAESALPEDWGARIVLQYNRDFEAIVLVNDGIFSPGLQKWIVLPNPSITALKRDSYAALPNVPGVDVFDLTLALRLPNGTPAVIFYTAEGQLAVNTLPETLYQELLTSERLPVLCASDVPRPERSEWISVQPASAEQSDAYIIFCEEDKP